MGPRHHSGDMNGMPFQISTRPSHGPRRPATSAAGVRANTEYRLPRRLTV